jgi:glycosyltransferase involved in cell wall biosynthesis
MSYSKVLIVGVHLRENYGDGVTVRNLFYGWPEDMLFFAATGEMVNQLSGCIAYETYQLGTSENRVAWPFSLFFNRFPSMVLKRGYGCHNLCNTLSDNSVRLKSSVRKNAVRILHFVGLYNIVFKLKPSVLFLQWVRQIEPDIIYFHPNSYQLIEFVHLTSKLSGVKAIYHVMDGTIHDVNKLGLLYFIWNSKTLKLIDSLNKRLAYALCISDKMSEVLKDQHGKDFMVFHNTVDVRAWKRTKTSSSGDGTFRITYAGRIGYDNWLVIANIARAIDHLRNQGFRVSFFVYSSNMPAHFIKVVTKYSSSCILPPVSYENIHDVLHRTDLLTIPLGFSKRSFRFSWLSMPTKTVEYMSSGVPILVIAPQGTALYQYACDCGWAIVLNDCSIETIADKIGSIIDGKVETVGYADKAYSIAMNSHDRSIISSKFRQILRNA